MTQSNFVQNVLKRINYSGDLTPNLHTLTALQSAFLLTVPFENLDIHAGRPINIDSQSLYKKIVEERRGGFCYECNSLFGELLSALGYRITIISARMFGSSDVAGQEFDHLTHIVHLAQDYLVDVGQGRGFRTPLLLDGTPVTAEGIHYRVQQTVETLQVQAQAPNENWKPVFNFTTTARQRQDFLPMCHYHQTSPDSVFTKQPLATLALPDGRISLAGFNFSRTIGQDRTEIVLESPAARLDCLETEFGLIIASGTLTETR